MINNDDRNKHEEQDEGEYHFSDEEVNYDLESESVKESPAVSKPGMLDRLKAMPRSRRMLLSLLVFLGLVFVVYKMVAPTATVAPPTDITPVSTIAQVPAPKPLESLPPPAATSPTAVPAAQVATTIPAPQAAVSATMPVPTSVVGAPTVSQAPTTLPPPGSIAEPSAQLPQAPAQAIQVLPPPGAAMVQPAPVTTVGPQIATAIPGVISQPQIVPAVSPTMPSVIAVQPTQPSVMPSGQPIVTTPITQPTPSSPAVALQSDLDKVVAQVGTEYGQRLNTYADQTKDLQDKMQTLNSRVANIENQMNQLIRIMTRQAEESLPASPTAQAGGQRIPYNVQAIIPGRAWLRSDNGETVTVAEGDSIRNLGRVTKIDPYDGIVEINTGTKTVTLTYGNGG